MLDLWTADGFDFLDLLGGLGYFGRQIGLRPCLGRLGQERTRAGQFGVALLELHHLCLRLLTTHGAAGSLCLLLLLLLGHDFLPCFCLRLLISSRQHLRSRKFLLPLNLLLIVPVWSIGLLVALCGQVVDHADLLLGSRIFVLVLRQLLLRGLRSIRTTRLWHGFDLLRRGFTGH